MKDKIWEPEGLARELAGRKKQGNKVVFTNGCFDLLHVGHVRYLRQARGLGDLLVVALNSDESVKKLKGPSRPIQPEQDRTEIMAALECVDFVTLFSEETPLELIKLLLPDVLAKGGDWPVHEIVGRDVVEAAGGHVLSMPYVEGCSSSDLIQRLRDEPV